MFSKLKITALTAIVLGTAGLAAAAPGGPGSDATRAERKAKMLEKFDTNRDGTLDAAEKEAMHTAFAQRKFEELDVNKDGKLTFDEFKAGKHGKFGKHHGRRGHGAKRGQ